MLAMFEFCCLCCEYAELHAPSSYGLYELLVKCTKFIFQVDHTESLYGSAVACQSIFFTLSVSQVD